MTKEVEQDGQTWVKCICDNCGEVAEDENEGFDLMPDESSAFQIASEQGWEVLTDGTTYCPDCIIDDEEE